MRTLSGTKLGRKTRVWSTGRSLVTNRSPVQKILPTEAFVLMGFYAACVGICIPTFRDILPVLSTRVKQLKKTGPRVCSKISVENYQLALRNITEERWSQIHRDGSLLQCV
jgi:hypothetical protein